MKTLIVTLLACTLSIALAPDAAAQRVTVSVGYGIGSRPVAITSHRWVPAHYETVYEPVWIPARTERIWVEPVYRTSLDRCGLPIRVLVCAGHWRTVVHPGYSSTRAVRVYRPGGWGPVGCR